jgi:ribonuclease HII
MLALKIHQNLIECGTDEAGRGCLAGPVMILNIHFLQTLNSSAKKREWNSNLS